MNRDLSTASCSIVMMGATGAVGGAALQELLKMSQVTRLTLLGRRKLPDLPSEHIHQKQIDIFDTASYAEFVPGHEIAICTLGVGQPSKMSKEEFVRIDKAAVLDFARTCKVAGVRHFELLSAVGSSSRSFNYYVRTKGELIAELQALGFERLSIFEPSMILTPSNRYGLMQGFVLKFWPLLTPLLFGGLRKYRGVRVEKLGKAMALNILKENSGFEKLTWDDFQELTGGAN